MSSHMDRSCRLCIRRMLSDSIKTYNVLSNENKIRVQTKLEKWNEKVQTSSRSSVTKTDITSAVLVPLCSRNGEPSILFTRRSSKLVSCRGEISFPGGVVEPQDNNDMTRTAIRETCEELGISETSIDIWGEFNLPKYITAWGRIVATPIIANIGNVEHLTFNLSKDEVERIHVIPLSHLCNTENHRYTVIKAWRRDLMSDMYYMPTFYHPECYIWGLTSIILCAVLPKIQPNFVHSTQLIKNKTAYSFFG